MSVLPADLHTAVQKVGLAGRAVCMHSSLRSFGWVDGGAAAVVDAFLAEGCTLIVPTFSYVYASPPPAHVLVTQNAWEGMAVPAYRAVVPGYSPMSTEIDRWMGAIPAEVLARPTHVRGNHPLNSFTAVGPLAHALIATQTPRDVYAPLRGLGEAGGAVLLAGVGLERMTLLHLAEQTAGRRLFWRWAVDATSGTIPTRTGGCSEGFGRLLPVLASLFQQTSVGASRWLAFPAAASVTTAAAAIVTRPEITHCADPGCVRCADSIAGGPIGGPEG